MISLSKFGSAHPFQVDGTALQALPLLHPSVVDSLDIEDGGLTPRPDSQISYMYILDPSCAHQIASDQYCVPALAMVVGFLGHRQIIRIELH